MYRAVWNNYLAETDNQNQIQAVYTDEPQSYGNLISQYRKGSTIWTPRYYQYDALGSTRALTDDGGDVTDTYLYDAWGNEVDVAGTAVNPFQWVGRVGYCWDEATGTFYVPARVYEPVVGRWMSEDPLAQRTGFGRSLWAVLGNEYRFAAHKPIIQLDSSGLAPHLLNTTAVRRHTP